MSRNANGVYTGVCHLVGNGIDTKFRSTATIVEIGEHQLRDLSYTRYMANYVNASDSETQAIAIYDNEIIAVNRGGITRHSLDDYLSQQRNGLVLFWIITFVLVMIPTPFMLYSTFVYAPRKRREVRQLIADVEAAIPNMKEKKIEKT